MIRKSKGKVAAYELQKRKTLKPSALEATTEVTETPSLQLESSLKGLSDLSIPIDITSLPAVDPEEVHSPALTKPIVTEATEVTPTSKATPTGLLREDLYRHSCMHSHNTSL